jgi:hypothetical protein
VIDWEAPPDFREPILRQALDVTLALCAQHKIAPEDAYVILRGLLAAWPATPDRNRAVREVARALNL